MEFRPRNRLGSIRLRGNYLIRAAGPRDSLDNRTQQGMSGTTLALQMVGMCQVRTETLGNFRHARSTLWGQYIAARQQTPVCSSTLQYKVQTG